MSGGCPDYQTLMAPVLHALADGAELPISQLRGIIAKQIGLTGEDLKATLPSGSRLFVNRLHWTITYLYQAGLVRRPRRAVVQITSRGQSVLTEYPDRVDNSILLQFKAFLEQLVLNVLTALGYRGAAGSAEHLGRSGDNGLDGVIRQDPLRLDQIYVQAKRYAAGHTVGRPEIQGFVGALHGAQADRACSSPRVASPTRPFPTPIAWPPGSFSSTASPWHSSWSPTTSACKTVKPM